MDKNSVIGFVLIALVFIGFSVFENNRARKWAEYNAQQDSIALAQKIAVQDSLAALQPAVQSEGESFAAPLQSAVYKDSLIERAYRAEGSIVALENEKIRIEFNTKGAQPHSALLKEYKAYGGDPLYLFRGGDAEYSFSIYAGQYLHTKDLNFELAYKDESSVVFRLPFSSGGYIEQKYTLSGDGYPLNDELSFSGMSSFIPRNVNVIDLDFNVSVPRMEKGYKNESQYSKLDYYFEGDKKPEEIGRGRSSGKRVDSKLSWFAFQQQFFSTILRAPDQFASG